MILTRISLNLNLVTYLEEFVIEITLDVRAARRVRFTQILICDVAFRIIGADNTTSRKKEKKIR